MHKKNKKNYWKQRKAMIKIAIGKFGIIHFEHDNLAIK